MTTLLVGAMVVGLVIGGTIIALCLLQIGDDNDPE